jgi:hypothetical protein
MPDPRSPGLATGSARRPSRPSSQRHDQHGRDDGGRVAAFRSPRLSRHTDTPRHPAAPRRVWSRRLPALDARSITARWRVASQITPSGECQQAELWHGPDGFRHRRPSSHFPHRAGTPLACVLSAMVGEGRAARRGCPHTAGGARNGVGAVSGHAGGSADVAIPHLSDARPGIRDVSGSP